MNNFTQYFNEYLTTKQNFPFLKIIRNFFDYSKTEREEWKQFLYDIWFDDYYFETYLKLVNDNYDLTQINYDEVRCFYLKLQFIFIHQKDKTLRVIWQSWIVKNFSWLLSRMNSINRVNEIILEYIFEALNSIIIDYETKRISAWIFNIVR